MSEIPEDLKYIQSHEWVRIEDGIATIGITDHAQEALGDLVFVELPETGDSLNVDDACGVVESVKAASDLFSPIAGEVIDNNAALIDEPELINSSPYSEGWLFKVRLAEDSGLENLLTAEKYAEMLAEKE
ncbi:MAG: glycine cleavage system protein GcvH [Candidatus Parabeggiatoa sp. nov. 3]|nr:MAG: glycine cleavage system protein GcvH [Gammaproteobacteria bacterium]RKZ84555.1 MAG: glycine cleavage system protein GcvH [Gammaproteobacteria bacterium]HEW98116.1 glycine cleavage system protein GcvH [Beggiatoa sp.]